MLKFKANNRMLILIVILFMSYDELGAEVLERAYEQMKRDGLV